MTVDPDSFVMGVFVGVLVCVLAVIWFIYCFGNGPRR